MFKHFISLQWKSFYRSKSFQTKIWIKVLMVLGVLYFGAIFLMLGTGSYFLLEKALEKETEDPFFSKFSNPLEIINYFLIFYFLIDLVFRYLMQKMPVVNIKPLLPLNIKKDTIVHFSLGMTVTSAFNWLHALFFIPFSIVLLIKGYSPLGVLAWHVSVIALIHFNNFLNILANKRDAILFPVAALVILAIVGTYYNWFSLPEHTQSFFQSLYDMPYMALIPITFMLVTYYLSHRFFKSRLYLDTGLKKKTKDATSENLDYLNRFGTSATFLKNDVKLLKRNKRSKTTLIMSGMFLLYGLFFVTDAIEMYSGPMMNVFAGIFVTGGFMLMFGQFVPSWDSSYYPLMMSQNVMYRDYLQSKWLLMVIGTAISMVLSVAYIYFGWEKWLIIFAVGVYNIGFNASLVLWAGAYVKTPIDLQSNKQAFGNSQGLNVQTMLLSLPKMLLPVGLFAAGYYGASFIDGSNENLPTILGVAFLVLFGVLGLLLKKPIFNEIERVYKKEKYKTIAAYKEVN